MALARSSSDPRIHQDKNNVFDDKNKFMTLENRRHGKYNGKRKKQFIPSDKSDHGFVRFHRPSGQQSVTIPLTTQMTVQDVCETFDVGPLYLKIGNQHIRQLTKDNRPLQMQNEIFQALGFQSQEECLSLGGSESMAHIFCFYTGRPLPTIQEGISNVLLIANCTVGRGKLIQRWTKKRCILYNDTIRIENDNSTTAHGNEGDEDNILLLNKYKVEVADSSHGRCLKLSTNTQKICFVFEEPGDLQQWSSHATQCSIVPICDLSDGQLLFLPDKLFYVGSQRMITSLNLRRNSLLLKPANTTGSPLIGWLDDVSRFPSLRTLNVADNCLYSFPLAVLQLSALMDLNLSGNRISSIPGNIRLLANLHTLNLSNNWLTAVPKQLSDCQLLQSVDLSFNRLQQIPPVLLQMPKLQNWELAGNYISSINVASNLTLRINKLDLRLNSFDRPIRLTSFLFEALTVLDLRRGGKVAELDLSNLSTIQVLYCSNIGLRTIQVNGTNLREFYAEHNALSQIIVMPMPANLTIISVAYNELQQLPEWITDIHKIVTISAHHNRIDKLPYRTMMNVSSLRHLLVGNNRLTKLPDIVENCSIEVMNIENNFIQKLPAELFKSAHQLRHLNMTNNRLTELPAANSFSDLNRLQSLRLSGNQLTESSIAVIVACRRLRLLDVSYNNFRFFNDSALYQLNLLEEINISGNKLTSLSTEIAQLPNLQILKAHSNKISAIPDLSFSKSLKVIDLSTNRLAKINVEYCVAENLKFLDLTCNPFSDTTHDLKIKSEKRAISIMDISKKSALSNIQFGFSETAGQKSKLCTRQIRPKDVNDITFAIIDGGSNPDIADTVRYKLGHKLEVPNRDSVDSLTRAILQTHIDIGEKGIRLGASAFVLRIIGGKIMCSSTGHTSALLSRRDDEIVYLLKEIKVTASEEYERLRINNAIITPDELINGVAPTGSAIGYSYLFPAVVPSPRTFEVEQTDDDDFVVVGNRILWQTLTEREIIEAVRQCNNPLQAAKRLQDMCQAHEQIGNISIIVIKFMTPQQRFDSESRSHSTFSTLRRQPNARRGQFSPMSLQIGSNHPQKPVQLRSFSAQRVDDSALRNIEDRLEKITVAINRIDSDSSGGVYYVNPPPAELSTVKNNRMSIKRLKEGHRSVESRLSLSVTESRSSTPIFSRHSIAEQSSPGQILSQDLNSYSPHTSDAGNSDDSFMFSQERFNEARNRVARELKLEQPHTTTTGLHSKQNLYTRRHHF